MDRAHQSNGSFAKPQPLTDNQRSGDDPLGVTSDEVTSVVRHKVRRFCKKWPLTEDDRGPVTQEVLEHLWTVRHRFKPAVASRDTFVECIIDNKLASIARSENAKCRVGNRRTLSLDVSDVPENGEISNTADTLIDRRTPAPDAGDIKHDLTAVTKYLTPRQRDIMARIGEGESASHICRNIRRMPEFHHEMGQIRAVLRHHDLDSYD